MGSSVSPVCCVQDLEDCGGFRSALFELLLPRSFEACEIVRFLSASCMTVVAAAMVLGENMVSGLVRSGSSVREGVVALAAGVTACSLT